MYCLLKKCKLLKANAKKWVNTRFGNINRQIKIVEEQLNKVQLIILDQGVSGSLDIQQDKLLNKHSKLLEFQNEYWKIRAKSNNLKLGDSNTKYYHTCASIRRNRNLITFILDSYSDLISHPKEVEQCFTTTFKNRFLSNSDCIFNSEVDFDLLESIISVEDNNDLCEDVSKEEIKDALFNLAPDKAPGPDGFTPFFFQKYWSVVGNSVVTAVKAFFSLRKNT